MLAQHLISDIIPPLKTSDTGDTALNWMAEFHIKHLPIVNNKQFLGLISEDDIMEQDSSEPIGSYSLSYYKPYIYNTDHIYGVMKSLADLKLTAVPVVDDQMNYIGLVMQENLLAEFSRMHAMTEPGGIIVLEVGVRDFYLSEIARIVESSDAKILSLLTAAHADSTKMEVTIKVNVSNMKNILASFDRFDYQVTGFHQEAENNELYKERFDSLMRFINT